VSTIREDLCRMATHLDAAAVVMAAHQHSVLEELLFGSVANSVAHHCDQPVIVLPPSGGEGGGGRGAA
jgi:nucleotide-binding universal stress UspA family protein